MISCIYVWAKPRANATQPTKRPFLVRQTPSSSLWFKKDDQFWVPKAHAIMQIVR
jgi:insulysin